MIDRDEAEQCLRHQIRHLNGLDGGPAKMLERIETWIEEQGADDAEVIRQTTFYEMSWIGLEYVRVTSEAVFANESLREAIVRAGRPSFDGDRAAVREMIDGLYAEFTKLASPGR